MIKLNGTEILETLNGAPGYGRVRKTILDAACNAFFLRRRLSAGVDFQLHPSRYKCGKKRPEGPRIVRIKKTELSRAKRNRSQVTGHRSLSQ